MFYNELGRKKDFFYSSNQIFWNEYFNDATKSMPSLEKKQHSNQHIPRNYSSQGYRTSCFNRIRTLNWKCRKRNRLLHQPISMEIMA